MKTGGGPDSSSLEDDDTDQTAMPGTSEEPAASMPATERVLFLLDDTTALEGIGGIMEIGVRKINKYYSLIFLS